MIKEGQIVLFRFPQTDLQQAKLRPALVLREVQGMYDDWLICMISSRIYQQQIDFDEVVSHADEDFRNSGLKTDSLIRVGRLAVVESKIFLGITGHISTQRLWRIKEKLSKWIMDE